jgi:hypothetical protein
LIIRRLIAPLAVAVVVSHAGQACAQGAFPAPLPNQPANASPFPPVGGAPAQARAMITPSTTVTERTLIPASLETAINTDVPGFVRAVVSQDVRSFDGKRVLIPRSAIAARILSSRPRYSRSEKGASSCGLSDSKVRVLFGPKPAIASS